MALLASINVTNLNNDAVKFLFAAKSSPSLSKEPIASFVIAEILSNKVDILNVAFRDKNNTHLNTTVMMDIRATASSINELININIDEVVYLTRRLIERRLDIVKGSVTFYNDYITYIGADLYNKLTSEKESVNLYNYLTLNYRSLFNSTTVQ